MSSGQGESAATKSDDDTERKSPTRSDKLASKDLVDHASVLSLDKDPVPFQELIVEETSNKTDSGFKDNLPSDVTDKIKSNSDNTDDNSDDDLELKWEDDESDEQNTAPLETVEKATENVSVVDKPAESDFDDTNLSSVDVADEKTEQNQNLESSSLNKDTNLSITSEIPQSNSTSNEMVQKDAVSDSEDIIDENQLLESPKSDDIDECELLKIPGKEELLLEDDLIKDDFKSAKSDIQSVTGKSPKTAPLNKSEKDTNAEALDTISIETNKELDNKKPEAKSETSPVAHANISGLETATQELSQVILSTSSPNESLMDTSLIINTDHGLNKPDMMLEIPTQEIIELDDTDLLTSGSYNDEDKMEVDSNTDSFKTAIDAEMDVEEPTLEKKTGAFIVKPGVFRALEAQEPSKDGKETKKTNDISEDDWCEIERRLEGFEESFSEETQLKKMSKESENAESTPLEDADSNQFEKDKNKDIQPLTEAQKIVIETENKELLKTLQDTSKLDTTEDQISTTMDVEGEILNPDIEGQPQSNENVEKVDSSPETNLQSNIEKTSFHFEDETTLNLEIESQPLSKIGTAQVHTTPKTDLPKSLEKTIEETSQSKKIETEPSDLDQVLETKESDYKTDAVDPKPLSPSKSAKEMEIEVESKSDNVVLASDISQIEEITTKPSDTPKVESPKLHDVVESTEIEQTPKLTDDDVVSIEDAIELKASATKTYQSTEDKEISIPKEASKNETSQSNGEDEEISPKPKDVEEITSAETTKTSQSIEDKEISPTPKDVGKISPPKTTETPESTVEDKDVDEIKNQSVEELADDEPKLIPNEYIPPTSKSPISIDKIVTPSTANSDNIVHTSAMEVEPTKVFQLSEQEIHDKVKPPSVSPMSVDKVVTPPTASSDNVVQTSAMEVEPTTVLQPTDKEIHDEVIPPSVSPMTIDKFVTASTANSDSVVQSSAMEVEPTKVSQPIDQVIPSTSQEKKTPPVTKSLGNIKVRSLASLMPFGQSSYVQPSNSVNLPLEQDDEGKSTVNTSSVIDKASTHEIQPSTSKVADIEVQPSTSKDSPNTEVQPSTSSEVPTASMEPNIADPDSDEVPEISDSLGLLAESSRVMEDDEDQDDDDDNDADGDDDDDYDPEDESSNQMTAEHSEDSNAPQSETDQAKEQDEKEIDIESPTEEKGGDEFSFTGDKDAAIGEEKDVGMEVDEVTVQDEIEVTPEQIGNEPTTDDVQQIETTAESKETEKEKPKQSDAESGKPTEKVVEEKSVLKQLLTKERKDNSSEPKTSPSKKLGIARPSHILHIVNLEESSSEEDIQEVKNDVVTDKSSQQVSTAPAEATADVASEVTVRDEKSDETAVKSDSKPSEDKPKPKISLEILSLDSDEEDSTSAPAKDQKQPTPTEAEKPREANKCINIACASSGNVQCYKADAATIAYYDAAKRRKALVCEVCADIVVKRAELLVKGIKELTPLLELDTGKTSSELVEISDSDSEDEADTTAEPKETIGESGAAFLEENLAKMINETWNKFCLDSRLMDAQDELNKDMEKLEAESKEIEAMLTECQVATDKLRNDLYATFEQQRKELPAIVMFDTPLSKYVRLEETQALLSDEGTPQTRAKRRMSSATETPAKRPAIPMGYTPLDSAQQTQGNKLSQPTVENTKIDDDKDISVLKVSAEMAPSDLPPPGELVKPPLRPGMCVYTMRNALGSWIRSRVLEVNGKSAVIGMSHSFTVCRVKYEHKPKGSTKLSPARCLAYAEPATVRLTIGTRVVALFKDVQNPMKKDAFYSGIIAEVPNPVNNYRYLVFFDDGYAQYVMHRDTRVVCECSPLVWEEVHPVSREFVKEYLMAYPERPMVRLHAGQSLKTEWNGKWWACRVIQVDASLVQVHFEEDNRTEWIYRGSTRLAPLFLELRAAERHRARPMPRTKAQGRVNMPYVEYTRSDEQANKPEEPATPAPPSEKEIRQRAVAKKSTALPQPPSSVPPPSNDSVTSRVVYYTPKNAVRPYKMTPHSCGPQCKRKDVLALKDLRTYNPLAKPLLSGWERQIVRYKGHKEVMYRAPCGRRLRNMRELHRYLRLIQSDMAVDLFDFTPHTHCLAEFVLNKCLVGKKDLSHGKENVPVPCVNYYDESLPEFCSYNTERTPTAGVPLNLDPEFLCGCDCTDDCEDKSKCACWQMTLEGARTIGLGGPNVGYKYKRLPEPLPSGIYECNSRCKCKQTCLNRVAQHPLQLKLQVFKTLNRGWGIRALNDVPKGSFLCVYAGNLLTDATANMDGLNEGDEYLAELDYIEVVEQMKEGYEEDIPEADKRLDKKNAGKEDSESEMSSSEEEDETPSKNEQEDGDFQPGYIGMGVSEFSKRLRKRDKNKKKKEERAKEKEKEADKTGDDCITISDDEEVREPSRFMAQAGMGKEFISKYRSVRSYFGKDEACYIMDAKVQGNIGRYLNHSCTPNVFVQNVFVDTHDPRFPWVAFFALSHIKAGTELTWNYNYDVGSVPGKILYCYCGAPNCRGRLL